VSSSFGKDRWSRKIVDGLLSNEKYIGQVLLQKTVVRNGQQIKNTTDTQYLLPDHHPAIISRELFDKVQVEKIRRSNFETTGFSSQRKVTKYNSGNVLSGLLICEECGSPCRRVTRSGGEVVWRCANRVEHRKAYCKASVTVTDAAVKEFLCGSLDMPIFDEQVVRKSVESITIRHDRVFEIAYKQEPVLSITL